MARNVESHYGAFIVNGTLYQTDWDFPAAAQSVGWSLRRVQRRAGVIAHLSRIATSKRACAHRGTDGTVDCPDCGVKASDFICAASDYLSGIAT